MERLARSAKKPNYFAQAFRSKGKNTNFQRLSDSETHKDLLGRILEVKKISSKGIAAKVIIRAYETADGSEETDPGSGRHY